MKRLDDPAAFLRDYWQKRPLLLRGALAGQLPAIDGDDLAGLACEPDVESRLLTACDGSWQLRHGPFDEALFATLPERDWTLLVQAVDQHIEDVAALRRHFDFLPAWRIDDIMVSYATAGGNVGPHFDHYDVFLLQGKGRREWQVGGYCDASTALRDHSDLQLLADFQAKTIEVLEPGDVLYLPPGIAHWGIALDDCVTFSVGLRAPSHAEVIGGFCDHLVASADNAARYTDPDLTPPFHPGEIDAAAIARLRTIVDRYLTDDAALVDWFGRYISEPKYPELFEESSQRSVGTTAPIRNPASRFAFCGDDRATALFVDGRRYDGTGASWHEFAAGLADGLSLPPGQWQRWRGEPLLAAVIDELLALQSLLLPPD